MAITLSNIALHKAAFAPMTFVVTGQKQLAASDTIAAIADNSGSVRLTVTNSIGEIVAFDKITITGADTDFLYLNGTWNVSSVNAGSKYIYTDIPYAAASSGTKGTVTRANTGVKEKVVVTVSAVAIATFYVYPVLVGSAYLATVDIAPYLQGQFTTDFLLTAGNHPDHRGHIVDYSVQVFEMNLKTDGTYYTGAAVDLSTGAVTTMHAHRAAELLVCDGGTPNNELLTRLKYQYFKPGDTLIVSGIFTTVAKAYVDFTGDGFTEPADSSELTITDHHLTSVFSTGATTGSFNVRFVEGLSEGASWISERIYFVRDSVCKAYPVTLYFLNRYGGFDMYNFKETASDKFIVEKWKNKTMQNVTATTREKKLIGRPETYANLQVLSDLISSPEVYDTVGNRLYIKSSDMILKDGDEVVYPEITIEIFENKFIN